MHKYHSRYFKIVSNFTRLTACEITYNNFETSLVIFIPDWIKTKIDFINYLSCVCSEKRCIKYIGHTHFTYKGWRRLSYPYLCSPWRKSDSIPAWLLFFSNITVKLTFLRMFSFVYNRPLGQSKWNELEAPVDRSYNLLFEKVIIPK